MQIDTKGKKEESSFSVVQEGKDMEEEKRKEKRSEAFKHLSAAFAAELSDAKEPLGAPR
jgi:hypothetical protein